MADENRAQSQPTKNSVPRPKGPFIPRFDTSLRLFVGHIALSDPLICSAAHPSDSVDTANYLVLS